MSSQTMQLYNPVKKAEMLGLSTKDTEVYPLIQEKDGKIFIPRNYISTQWV